MFGTTVISARCAPSGREPRWHPPDLQSGTHASPGRPFAPELIAANERSLEQRLAAAKMVATADDATRTVLGLLVLGIRPRDFLPGAYIQLLRIAGRDLADPIIDELVIDGSVSEILRRIDDRMSSHSRVAVDFTTGSTEIRIQPYPLVALRQIVRNALLHHT